MTNTLLEFLFYLNKKNLITDYDFDFEKEIGKFLKKTDCKKCKHNNVEYADICFSCSRRYSDNFEAKK